MKLKTLKAFSGPDGRHAKDVIIDVSPARADWLVENGFAMRLEAPAQKVAPRLVRKAAPKATAAKTARKAK